MKNWTTILTTFLGLSLSLMAQPSLQPKAVSTAGTAADITLGPEVLGWNPARLAAPNQPRFALSFGLLPLVPFPRTILDNSTLDAHWLNDNLYRGYFSPEDIQTVLAGFPESGWEGGSRIQLDLLGISAGSFALAIRPELDVRVNVPKDLFRLVFQGLRFEDPIHLFDVNVAAQGVIPVSIGYGMPLPVELPVPFVDRVRVGAAVKPLIGLFDARTVTSEGYITSLPDKIQADGTLEAQYALGGFGLALDAGAEARVLDRIQVGLSLNNLFGTISWGSGEARVIREKVSGDLLNTQFEDLQDDSLRTDILNSLIQEDTSYASSGYTTDYPAYLNLSGRVDDLLPGLTLMMNIRQYFQDTDYSTTTPRLSLAAQYQPLSWLSLRGGVSLGGMESFQWGTGLGLEFSHYQFEFGFSQNRGLFNSAKGFTLSLGQNLLF